VKVEIQKIGDKFSVRISENWEHFQLCNSLAEVLSYLTTIDWKTKDPLRNANLKEKYSKPPPYTP